MDLNQTTMAEAKTTRKTVKEEISLGEKMVNAFREYKLENGKDPSSIYSFCKHLKISESDFYSHYNSFAEIEREFWTNTFKKTVDKLKNSAEWESFSSREKLLAFYFTWFEDLLNHRSFALLSFPKRPSLPNEEDLLKPLKHEFHQMVKELMIEGESNGEIANRKFISDKYADLLWMQFVFLFDYWRKDSSKRFENTDAAIEKSVNLGFDLMGRGLVESLTDFAKFLLKSK